ncbi:unnamed protein product [Sphagnum compactum]
MPASPNLFKVLTAEDPKSLLEDEIGCMTGIFQIFDRSQAFTGRRYGSKRVTSAAVCSNSSQEEEEEEEEESNNSNRRMKSVQDLVVDRSSSSVPHSKEYPKPPALLVVPSREMCAAAATPEGSGGSSRQHCNSKDVQKLPSSLDIQDVVRASFHRERPRDSTAAFDFRESLRAADFKDLLRASQKVRGTTTDAPRFSVDGTRDPPHVHLSPRLSVDGRDSPRACGIPPRLKLDGRDATRAHGKLSSRSDGGGGGALLQLKKENNAAERGHQGQGEAHRRIPNVVARLMGLEELPSSDPGSQAHPTKVADYHTLVNPPSSSSSSRSEARLLQGLLQYTPATVVSPPLPPPPSQSDDYNYKQHQPLSEEEPLYGLMDQEMRQLHLKNSVQGRKLLRHILHAMQLKGLLHHPPGRNRKQSSEDVKAAAAATQQQQQLQVPKATTSSSGSSSLREPNGSSSSDTEAVTVVTPRMSRKERIAARSSKSSQLDAAAASQGGGRDVSPARSPRLLTSSPLAQVGKPRLPFLIKEANPLKPGLLSPGRCADGGSSSSGPPQLVESSGSKASSWSTKSFMVKDREETKATLFTLRAQSTKQEFLKGRASGGPDTPRPLRRSSSDSKLISRMTEKLTATDATAAAAAAASTRTAAAQAGGAQGGRILIPAEVTISRSKRKTGKPNNPTPKCRTSSSSSSCALDTTTETLPSPVSVLDNFHFQEEDLTPSPSKTSSNAFDESLHRDHLEEAKAALKGLADIRSRDLCNQQQDYLCHNNKQSVEILVPIDNAQQAGTHYSLAGNNNTVVHGICLWSKDEEREYVRDVLVVSRVITEDDDDDDDTSSSGINNCCLQWGRSSGYNNIMDVNQFDDLEARWRWRQQQQASSFNNTKENDFFLFERRQTCLENEAVGRRVLFDGTNEILVQKLDPVKFNPLPWIGGRDRPQPQEKPSGQQLIQQVWDELQDVPCVASEDVCDTLYTILHKDLRNTEKKWSDMDGEVSEVSLDLERMIVKDLIDEIVKDLTVQATTTTNTTTTKLIDEAAAAAIR